MRKLLSAISCLFSAIFIMCTPPPKIDINDMPEVLGSVLVNPSEEECRASGIVSVKINKKSYNADVIVGSKRDSFIHADIYSPMGTIIAGVDGDSNGLFVKYENRIISFTDDSLLSVLSVFRDKAFTYNELILYFSGNLSGFIPLFRQPPFQITDSGKCAISIWNTDVNGRSIKAVFNRKTASIQSISVTSKNSSESWIIVFKRLKSGRAHSILFKQDGNNYFSIEYDKFKTSGDRQINE